jgi:hypothetical protein
MLLYFIKIMAHDTTEKKRSRSNTNCTIIPALRIMLNRLPWNCPPRLAALTDVISFNSFSPHAIFSRDYL